MQNKSALIAGVLAGLSAPGSFTSAVDYPRPHGSDLGRLRGDMSRVGRDFSNVIEREHGKQKSASKAKSQSSAES